MFCVLFSCYRYHLRWLVDETPLRAEKIQLFGQSPAISARSVLHQLISITPAPTQLAKSNEIDIAPSSAIILALEQLFNGITVFSEWNINKNVLMTQSSNKVELLFESLENNYPQVKDTIQQIFQRKTKISMNVELLSLAQVNYY